MTVENCVDFCNGQKYIYAGVEYAQECCKYAFSLQLLRFCSFWLFYSIYVFASQIVEISFHMGQQMFHFRIATSNALEIRVRFVVLVIALTFIGVVRPLRLHLKSCQVLDCGNHLDAIRKKNRFSFLNERRPSNILSLSQTAMVHPEL
jgi:hypothetical protein